MTCALATEFLTMRLRLLRRYEEGPRRAPPGPPGSPSETPGGLMGAMRVLSCYCAALTERNTQSGHLSKLSETPSSSPHVAPVIRVVPVAAWTDFPLLILQSPAADGAHLGIAPAANAAILPAHGAGIVVRLRAGRL